MTFIVKKFSILLKAKKRLRLLSEEDQHGVLGGKQEYTATDLRFQEEGSGKSKFFIYRKKYHELFSFAELLKFKSWT